MNRLIYIRPWDSSNITAQYDILISALGYERRSRYFSEAFMLNAPVKIAFGFPEYHVLEYNNNRIFFAENGFSVEEVDDSGFENYCATSLNLETLLDSRERNNQLRIGFDVSSMSRSRIAIILAAVLKLTSIDTVLDFFYSNAEFVPAPKFATSIQSIAPIHPYFAGWTEEPEMPSIAILGLGYELDKSVGILEYLEPASTWAFQTFGPNQVFQSDVMRANQLLQNLIPEDARIEYNILRPFDCFQQLESLSYGAMRQGRVILIPLGPKIFTVCCLAVACVHYPDISVWRVSAGQNEVPVNRIPTGDVVGLRFEIRERFGRIKEG